MSTNIYSKFKPSKYINLYFKIINNPNKLNEEYTEKHHILPKAIWPEHEFDKCNIVVLSAREHYIVHLLLYKHFKSVGQKREMHQMFNAVWLMLNANEYNHITSRHYAYCKKQRSEYMQGNDFGKAHKGTTVVRHASGLNIKAFRVPTNDPRVLSGELVGINKGITLSAERRNDISKTLSVTKLGNTNVRGTKWVTDGKQNTRIQKSNIDLFLNANSDWYIGRSFHKRAPRSKI